MNGLPSDQDRKAFISLFDKYVPQCISMILEGVVDGRQGEKLSTIVPVTNLNMVNIAALLYLYTNICHPLIPILIGDTALLGTEGSSAYSHCGDSS